MAKTNAEYQAKWQAKRKLYIKELEKRIKELELEQRFLLEQNEKLEAEIKKPKIHKPVAAHWNPRGTRN